jgi:arylsulfatase A-like enzyme
VGRHADELKPVLGRQMEIYAGFLEHTDHHVGRLLDALESWHLDDTLVYSSSATTARRPKARCTARSTR